MGRIIAVANQKGGVAKTTTAVNLAAGLGNLGSHVLIVDNDPQGSATSGFGVDKRNIGNTTYSMIIGEIPAEECIRATGFSGVDILPADKDLSGAELELVSIPGRESRMREGLAPIKDRYDYIVIDCPPSLSLLTINALTAADSMLIPVQCEFYALEGLSQLMNTAKLVKKMYNPALEIEGILFTMYDGRLNLTLQVAGEVKKFFPNRIFKSVIPRNVRLSEAPSHGMPIMYYDRYSKGSEAYMELAREIRGW